MADPLARAIERHCQDVWARGVIVAANFGRSKNKRRSDRSGKAYKFVLRSLSALVITDTELKLMAAAAMIGLSSIPNLG